MKTYKDTNVRLIHAVLCLLNISTDMHLIKSWANFDLEARNQIYRMEKNVVGRLL